MQSLIIGTGILALVTTAFILYNTRSHTKPWYLRGCKNGCAICNPNIAPPNGEKVEHIYE